MAEAVSQAALCRTAGLHIQAAGMFLIARMLLVCIADLLNQAGILRSLVVCLLFPAGRWGNLAMSPAHQCTGIQGLLNQAGIARSLAVCLLFLLGIGSWDMFRYMAIRTGILDQLNQAGILRNLVVFLSFQAGKCSQAVSPQNLMGMRSLDMFLWMAAGTGILGQMSLSGR